MLKIVNSQTNMNMQLDLLFAENAASFQAKCRVA